MILSILLIVSLFFACLFFIGTSVGILRFPDFLTRMHAAGKGDTLSTMLFVLAAIFYTLLEHPHGSFLVCLKLLFIIIFIFIGSPTATHALTDVGQRYFKEKKSDD